MVKRKDIFLKNVFSRAYSIFNLADAFSKLKTKPFYTASGTPF
jgi:hypothetical protein